MFLLPQEYARGHRPWKGTVPLTAFRRVRSDFGSTNCKVEIDLEFYLDGNKRSWMRGTAKVAGLLQCKQCLKHVQSVLFAEISACLMSTSEIEEEDISQFDVVEMEEGPMSIVDLVEDDLIMSLPWKACRNDDECASDRFDKTSAKMQVDEGHSRPFANLKQLLGKQKSG